jgi:hypothetical protein
MKPFLSIPLDRLSNNHRIRHGQLRDYFCDKDAVATISKETWRLHLHWSEDPERYVDPHLAKGLSWCGAGLKYQKIAEVRSRHEGVLLCLNDTWTLHSWSEWINENTPEMEFIVLHIDDHKDLDSPRIFFKKDEFLDLISGDTFNLYDPDSVAKAILSGSLGMGSFLTPFLYLFPSTEVRHLCQPPKCNGTTDWIIKPDSISDELLNPEVKRPSINLSPITGELNCKSGVIPGRYRITNNIESWLDGLPPKGDGSNTCFFLHIDMDYFCNRYDGDSDAINFSKPHNPELKEILKKIDEVTQSLADTDLLARLNDIVIAFSPGFFPAEYWQESCDRLLNGLKRSKWRGL